MKPLPSGILNQFIERASQLYTLPQVAIEVLELTGQPQVNLRALKDCIENDPALTSRLLRVVNSSMYGLSRQVNDLNQALALLGVKPLKMLVLGFSLPPNLLESLEADVLADYWRRALTTAVASREISRRWLHSDGDEAFIAGLLQSIGMLVLIQQLGEQYLRFLEQMKTEGGDLLDLEAATLGFDHQILSARLLQEWKLPHAVTNSIAVCHDSSRIAKLPASEQQLPEILFTASLLTNLVASAQMQVLPQIYQTTDRIYQATEAETDELILELQQRVDSLANVLALQLPPGIDIESFLAQAQREQSETSLDMALNSSSAVRTDNVALQTAMAAQVSAATTVTAEPVQPPSPASQKFKTRTITAKRPKDRKSRDPGLSGRVRQSLAASRKQRNELSLLLIEVDSFETVVLQRGLPGAKHLLDVIETAIGVMTGSSQVLHLGDGKFAVLLEDCPRIEAVEFARGLKNGMNTWSGQQGAADAITLSCGIATIDTPPPNFGPADLIEPAQRAVYASRATGGDLVKSIDLI